MMIYNKLNICWGRKIAQASAFSCWKVRFFRPQFFLFFLAFAAAFFFGAEKSWASDWVLAAQEFSFSRPDSRSEASLQAANLLPQLILEQIASDEVRLIPSDEILGRKLHELQTERLSLFLQLSKENKTRDSLILQARNKRSLEKQVSQSEKKIDEIQKKIDENLRRTEKEKREFEKTQIRVSEPKKEKESVFSVTANSKFNSENQIFEKVVLFNDDSSSLFVPDPKSLADGYDSWNFEKNILDSKINGLISGNITLYGEYCSVTVELRRYPEGKLIGTVTEVGTLGDLMALADRIAQNLDSKIANSLPVLVEFLIQPEEAFQNASIIIDGVVHSIADEKKSGAKDNLKILEAGIHNVSIVSPGYETLSLNYSFTGDTIFKLLASMKPESHGVVNLRLKKYRDGIFYASGTEAKETTPENPYAEISVNGRNVLGVFSPTSLMDAASKEDSKNIAFYRITENHAFDGAYLFVNAKPYNREANIDKRRRMMYTAYSGVICSLPVLFYCYGNYTSEKNSHNLATARIGQDDVQNWKKRTYVAGAVTSVLGVWAVIELVRYLWAADKVLPANAKIDRKNIHFMQEQHEFQDEKENLKDEVQVDMQEIQME